MQFPQWINKSAPYLVSVCLLCVDGLLVPDSLVRSWTVTGLPFAILTAVGHILGLLLAACLPVNTKETCHKPHSHGVLQIGLCRGKESACVYKSSPRSLSPLSIPVNIVLSHTVMRLENNVNCSFCRRKRQSINHFFLFFFF